MCAGCNRVWSILHVLWSVLYVTSGAAQLVAGIFFLLAIPSLVLGCNLITGLWNICMGIGVGMVACCGRVSPRRQEYLLYMIVSILAANVANVIVGEWGFYTEDLPKLLEKHQYHLLVLYASFATRIAAAAVILVSFVDSQLTFCSMHATRPNIKQKLRGSHEQVSDIEYIIPRPKTSGASTKQHAYNAYNTQSWVFESDNVNAASHAAAAAAAASAHHHAASAAARHAHPTSAADSPYLKLPQDTRAPRCSIAGKRLATGDLANGGVVIVADTTYLIDNPMVHIDEASDDSASATNSDRQLGHMKSFSRAASPAVLSAASSQTSLHRSCMIIGAAAVQPASPSPLATSTQHRAIVARTPPSTEVHYQTPRVVPNTSGGDRGESPRNERVQYASLMKELRRAIDSKQSTSPPSSSHSDGNKSSDAEFSKELEAALQLIQDLESPNTIDTPSEASAAAVAVTGVAGGGGVGAVRRTDSHSSDSEKTLSAGGGSLAEIASPPHDDHATHHHHHHHHQQHQLYTFKPAANGKSARIVVQYSDSQSTSGYSSPTHNKSATPKCWSTTSSLNGSNTDLGGGGAGTAAAALSYTIHNTKSTAVISLFTAPTESSASAPPSPTSSTSSTSPVAKKCGKSITLVNITGDNQPIHDTIYNNNIIKNNNKNIDTLNNNNNNNNNVGEKDIQFVDECDHSNNKSVRAPAPVALGSSWNVKSLLRRKKSSAMQVPKLCPELEGAIVKSECLAYLSERELLARHQRNKDIQRQIEQRVQQQLGTPWNDND